MEGQTALLHALHDGVFACSGRTGDDDQKWLWMVIYEIGVYGHAFILPDPRALIWYPAHRPG
jgi:hypothetical protein